MRSTRYLVGALLLGACGPDGGAAVDALRPDVAEGPATCSASGVIRTMVVTINGDTDSIKVFGLDGGTIVDPNLVFTSIENPDDVAIRSDGGEAIVSFGGFGQKYGVAVLELGPSASSARIKQTLEIGMDRVVFGVAYASDDHAILATAAGPSGHTLVAIDRTAGGDFAAGMSSPVPDDWPLGLASRPGHDEAVLLRADLSSDTNSTYYRLQRSGAGAWTPGGAPAMIVNTPLDMAISSDGNSMFAATSNPADPVSSTNLDGTGLMHAVPLGDSGFGAEASVQLPGSGSMVADDPHGNFVITDSPVFELDPNTGTPISHTRRLFTVTRIGATLGEVKVQTQPWPALLLYGLEVAGSGHVVRSLQLYPSQAPDAEQTPIEVLLPDGTGNFMTCATRFLPGQGRFAISR